MSAVASGKEALALLRTKAHLKEYFDVVLLDQDMPGMTGMQLASKIKEDSSLNHDILLIMLTGMSSAPSKIIARNAGIKRILAKPVAGYTLKTTLPTNSQRQAGSQHRPSPTAQPLPPLEVPSDFRILVAEDNSISTSHPRHAEQAQPATGYRLQRRGSAGGDQGSAVRPGADGL